MTSTSVHLLTITRSADQQKACSWLAVTNHRYKINENISDVTILVFSSRFDFNSIFYKEFNVDSILIFTVLHVMQTRSSDENSVRLSVTRVYCDKTEERSVQIFIPYER